MMHPLAAKRRVDIALAAEKVGGEDIVRGLGFLKAQDVRLMLLEQPLDDRNPGPDRVDIPGGDRD